MNRSLRQHQDEAFLESLRADQEKERRKEEQRLAAEAEERRRREVKSSKSSCSSLKRYFQELIAEEERRAAIARQKIDFASRVPSEPDSDDPDAVHIVIKLPCGERLDRRFLKTHSLEVVHYFVFCHPDSPGSFEITTNFPKRVLRCLPDAPGGKVQTLAEAGLKNREVLFITDLDA